MIDEWNSMTVANIKKSFFQLSRTEQAEVILTLKKDKRKSVQNIANNYIKCIKKEEKELERLTKLWEYENLYYDKGFNLVAGTDEVGRGCLAGPVVAAAVVLPKNFMLMGINDSKKISEKKREEFSEFIKKNALYYSIKEVSPQKIDEINILHAAELAMREAVEEISEIDFVLVDGDNKPDLKIPYKNIIQGDSKSISIAAASIIAKVYRDKLMEAYDAVYPHYGFALHKGYGTNVHYDALKKYGPSSLHRRSFRLI